MYNDVLHQHINAYQRALIRAGVTGSSIAGVFRGPETLALSSVASDLPGDVATTENTIFPIWSMSKPITTVAMMILLDRGLYLLNDPIKHYIPNFADIQCRSADPNAGLYPCKNDLLIKHLLSHRSGYQYYEKAAGPHPADPFLNLDEFVRHAASHPLEFEPGTHYLYGINQAILGRLIEVLTQQDFYTFLKKEILDPLGMADTKFFLTADDRKRFQPLYRNCSLPVGYNMAYRIDSANTGITTDFDVLSYSEGATTPLGGEGLVSTLTDYRKFCEMLLNGGAYLGQRMISKTAFDTMTTVVTPHSVQDGAYDLGFGYAFSLFVLEEPLLEGTGAPAGIFGWSGYHNTHFWIDRHNDLFGVFLTRTTPDSSVINKQFRAAVYRGLNNASAT